MDNTLRDKLLDYAIERINQYDKLNKDGRFGVAKSELPSCSGCTLADYDCSICPFNIIKEDDGCRPNFTWRYHYTIKNHQDNLIKSTKDWCKKFHPEYTIKEIK